ncbi:MAG: lipoate--protein ligase family protein [Fimbriimonadaceae bacterium]|nr:lipoate--protein ligase family protein [Fimbriimonadaceae bacterium]
MAFDEHLLQTVAAAGPAVRVYAWQPAALSLGYGQPVAEVDRGALSAAGGDLTRRLTGGRAVLHETDEITYSVVVEAGRLNVGRSVSRAYALLCEGLLSALRAVGVPVEWQVGSGPAAGPERDPACYAATIGGDLSVGGRKLVGSAQCHRFGGILQHGAVPRRVDRARLDRLLRRPSTARQPWTSLSELDLAVSPADFASALATGFEPLLGAVAEPTELTAADQAAIAELAAKYASEAWLARI